MSGFTTHEPAGFFVLRTPAWSACELERFSAGLLAPVTPDGPKLAAALEADRALLRARLRAWSEDPRVRSALYLAAPGVLDAARCWRSDPEGKRGRDAERTLVRYFSRSCTRATPFGLLAGVAAGRVGSATRIELEPHSAGVPRALLDVEAEQALCDAALAACHPDDVVLRTADVIADYPDRLHAVRRMGPEAGRPFELLSVERTPELDLVLERALHRALRGELVALLRSAGEVESEEAAAFVDSLVSAGLLVQGTTPLVTGARRGQGPVAANALRAGVEAALAEVAAGARDSSPERIARGADELRRLTGTASEHVVQVDLLRPASACELGVDVAHACLRGAALLRGLFPAEPDARLAAFRGGFERRFGARWVPLLEALDEERGVGFGDHGPRSDSSPLLADLPLGVEPQQRNSQWAPIHDVLLQHVVAAAGAGSEELVLTDAEISAALREPAHVPPGFQVLATLAGERVHVKACTGSPGGSLLARFAHLDEDMQRGLRVIAEAEAAVAPDVLHVELVHLPPGRAGNVVRRPVLRELELTCFGQGSAPPESVVRLRDLRVAVRRGEVVLWDVNRDREVRVHLSTAHAFHASDLAVYRFLGALQAQLGSGAVWSWGPLRALDHLPRVVHENIVLARREWRLRQDACRELAVASGAERQRYLRALRARLDIPRHVALREGDQELALDLENVLLVESLAGRLPRTGCAELVELLPPTGRLSVVSPDGAHHNEVVIPFVASAIALDRPSPRGPRPVEQLSRRVPPGSEWDSWEIHCGEADADRLLIEVVRPLVLARERAGTPIGMYYLRYADPEHHLRLRLRRPDAEIESLLQAELERGRVWSLRRVTYDREVERYGGPASMLLAESAFEADSRAALELVAAAPGGTDEARWRLACAGVVRMLADLGLEPDERRAVLSGSAALVTEHGGAGALMGALRRRFKAERAWLRALVMDEPDALLGLPASATSALWSLGRALREVGAELRRLERAGRLWIPMYEIARSLVHMHVNRVARSSPRAHEMAILALLSESDQREAARESDSRSGGHARRPTSASAR